MPSRHRRPTFLLSRSHRSPVHRVTPSLSLTGLLLCALATTAAGPVAAAVYATPEGEEPAWSDAAYTYFRVVEGTATLFPGDTAYDDGAPATADEVVVHQPVLVGDRLTVDPGARLELVLSDGSLLRLQGPSEVVFEAVAGSPDTDDDETVLRLTVGELQLVRLDDPAGADGFGPAVIETPDSRIILERAGTYRVSTGVELGGSRLTVREGLAEMVTDHGSILVREGDEAVLETGVRPRVAFTAAGPEDDLERWGRWLWDEAGHSDPGPVEPSLRYSAAGLSRHGNWVHVDGQTAWRPRVEPDWRPYWSGRWVYTPSGYLWVSYEPWGWVPYHYGTWALDPGYGWVWFPGNRFAPAWVYWHWGDSHVAWVPIGYYSHHYARHHYGHFGLRFGHYGFASGLGHSFRHWLFADHHHFHHHDLHHHAYPWHHFRDRHHRDGHDGRIRRDVVPGGRDLVPRGIVTTDSRGFGRGEGTPRRLALRRDDLPDVSAFVAREPGLSPELERRLVTRQPERRLAGTPLAPGTRAPRSLTTRRASPRTRGATPSERTTLRDSRRLTPRGSDPEATRRGSLRPRAVTPRAATPGDRSPRATSPRRVTPRAESPGARRPARVTPRGDLPRTERREPLRPRSARPGAVQPRAERPTTVRPRATAPRSTPPRSLQPRSLEPRTRRPETSRSGGGETGLRPRSATPGTTPRAVRPGPSRPPTRSPSARTPSSRRPEAQRPPSRTPATRTPTSRTPTTRRPSTRSPSIRRPSPSRPGLTPRSPSSSGVRRGSPSTSRSTPRAGVSRSRPRDGKPAPRARSGGGSSRSGGKATSRRGGSRGEAGASRGRGGSSRSRGGASRRGGG